ncbi:phage regulatory CII family protein [Psychrobacter sp. AOP5-GZ1-6]|uniref:phage regulatory CII family protein n=1 Tax=Psychrobacter sp. AOP5-GZ1-6 TaxID=3457649 RepID=UPI00402B9407
MDVIDAAHKTVHSTTHGGSAALATRLGMSVTILNNKVNPNATAHHLRLDEAVAIMEFTGDHGIIQSMAQRLGGVYCEVGVAAKKDDLIMTALSASACQGDVMSELHQALEDGQISCDQRVTLKAKIQTALSELQALAQHVDEKHASDNPHIVARWQAEFGK